VGGAPYRLEARIGAGGMGRVYLARTVGGRPLAVKVVRPEFADDTEFRGRFRREVAAARRVHGMFTAEVVDADVDAPLPWLATVYVPASSLQDVITGRGALPARSVRSLTTGLAEALREIHTAGVIHRDLRPSNVLMAADGPRVIDFGIARAADATSITRTGVAIGSPLFMSPEQADGGPITSATDVFALGAVIVFAGTGQPPFGDDATPAVLYRIVHTAPVLDGLPADLHAFAAACLDKAPRNRPSPDDILGWPFMTDPTVDDSTMADPTTARDRPPDPVAAGPTVPSAVASVKETQPVPGILVDSTVIVSPPPVRTPPPARTRAAVPVARGEHMYVPWWVAGVVVALVVAFVVIPFLADTFGPPDVRRIATLPGDSAGTPLVFSPDGSVLAATGVGNIINLWDAATGQRLTSLTGHTATIHSLAFSVDGRVLASGDTEKYIRWWDMDTHQQINATDIRHDTTGSFTLLTVTRSLMARCLGRWTAKTITSAMSPAVTVTWL
jgi:serine/threonine protein kinase